MRARYVVWLFAVIIFGTLSCIGSDYQMIGKGGPDRIELNLSEYSFSESRYKIFFGLPDLDEFYIPENPDAYDAEESPRTIRDYVYNESLKGHVFAFQGSLIVGDYEDHSVDISPPGRIIIKDVNGLLCRQQYHETRTCHIYSGYLVDDEGNLERIKELRIIPDSESGLKYEGTGYLVRIQHFENKSSDSTLTVPDPGEYNITWSGVERRTMPISANNA